MFLQVDGPIPFHSLQRFLERELKEDQVARGARKRTRKYHWYTRYHMWYVAERLFGSEGSELSRRPLNSLGDLEDWEFEKCLEEVHLYLRHHSSLRGKGSKVLVAKGFWTELCGRSGRSGCCL